MKIVKPYGKFTPWVWSLEIVRGCNLACWHCTARLYAKQHKPLFMSRDTWVEACKVMAHETPFTRLELAQSGEPTLHPELLDFLSIAKRLTPTTQIQVTTNGVTLLKGKVTLRELFKAGANTVYIDTYADQEKYIEMAKASGAEWYLYNTPKVGTPNHHMANTFYNDPSLNLVILQGNPENRIKWRKAGRLSTFLNHIDWNVAIPNGLVPVREPYSRRCTLPMRYVSTSYEGDYIFCCIDFWCETAGLLGNVRDGAAGFQNFWFGRLMQSIRRRLNKADRVSIPYCSRCNCAFSKCDWTHIWGGDAAFDNYYDGSKWIPLPPKELDDEVFADGWARKAQVMASLPSLEEEDRLKKLPPRLHSIKEVIPSTIAADKAAAKS